MVVCVKRPVSSNIPILPSSGLTRFTVSGRLTRLPPDHTMRTHCGLHTCIFLEALRSGNTRNTECKEMQGRQHDAVTCPNTSVCPLGDA